MHTYTYTYICKDLFAENVIVLEHLFADAVEVVFYLLLHTHNKHTPAYASIRQHIYVSIRQHTSA